MASKDIKALFLTYGRELRIYLARQVRDGDTAAELTQQTFLRFAEQEPTQAAAIIHPRSYLYRTAHNLAVDHIRRQQRESRSFLAVEDLTEVADERPLAERAALGRSDLAVVRQALLELPERTRRVFALARIERLTYAEVARRLAISESSVQKHLAKAIKHVMQRLRSG